jgi:hypothetical protein
MTLDEIIQTLRRVEAIHPDTVPALAPIVALLAGDGSAWIGPADAGRVLGLSPSTVVSQLQAGFLPGERDPETGDWRLMLAEILRERAWREAVGGPPDSPWSDRERRETFAAGHGSFPWQRERTDT